MKAQLHSGALFAASRVLDLFGIGLDIHEEATGGGPGRMSRGHGQLDFLLRATQGEGNEGKDSFIEAKAPHILQGLGWRA